VLFGGPANLSLTRWVLEQERQGDHPLTVPELQVLTELVRERRATTAELAHVLQRTEAETRNHLVRMVERGWVEARGEGKGQTWHLSAAVYRALEASAGYVRVRGFEPLQQKQMVLAYVEAHHRISRAEATELCAITPAQASRLLRRLAVQASSSGAESAEAASTKSQRLVTARWLNRFLVPSSERVAEESTTTPGRGWVSLIWAARCSLSESSLPVVRICRTRSP
jgi:DNA-binding MarR family transcriptional regulator